ncbi:hypothetical protein ACFXOJ_35565, partial [Streptomyces vinaceus]
MQFLDYVEVMQTDNEAEFQSAFYWNVLAKGIAHTYINPASPHLNGKVERSHRIDANASSRRPRPRCNRAAAVAHLRAVPQKLVGPPRLGPRACGSLPSCQPSCEN